MLEEIKSKFKHFMKILDLIESKQSHYDGISYITQKEISSKLKISQTNVNSKLNLLEKYGAINKIKAGQYRL
ncbi:winged helix-turn-helix transcriptional regulator, partial [Escherichia coli]|nr:winged helix-turn-helix transcriptional regulator [Escherichia coli]